MDLTFYGSGPDPISRTLPFMDQARIPYRGRCLLWIRPRSYIVDVAILWIRPGSHIVDVAFLWIRPRSWFWGTSYKLVLPCGPAAGAFLPANNAFLGKMTCHIRENAYFIPPYGPGPGPRPPYGPGPGPGPPPLFPYCPPMRPWCGPLSLLWVLRKGTPAMEEAMVTKVCPRPVRWLYMYIY